MNVEMILKTKGNDVVTTKPDSTLADVAATLTERKIGALVVSPDAKRVAGIVSERDIVRAIADKGVAALKMPVAEAMTRKVSTCTRADSVEKLMTTMSQGRFRHLPVVEDGKLCGMISIGDVVKFRLEEVEHEAEVLREFISS
ncbi:MAG: CBS domain-containing protein [Inquilinus sp.]|nr:CBS domain-containing protein [Inquilinus sp.]